MAQLVACLLQPLPGLQCSLAQRLVSPTQGEAVAHYIGDLRTLSEHSQQPECKSTTARFIWGLLATFTGLASPGGSLQLDEGRDSRLNLGVLAAAGGQEQHKSTLFGACWQSRQADQSRSDHVLTEVEVFLSTLNVGICGQLAALRISLSRDRLCRLVQWAAVSASRALLP